ncbi:MAG: M48 family metalloprotease [Candidatus Eremiobacteraeota bacterium]|nr:M48 family metalloprotease [Candidatus Eremiobacteraeota bacterium]
MERYVVERRYGLTDQSALDWLRDRAKMTAVSMALSTPIVAGLLAIVRRFPRGWPFVASAASPLLLIFLSLIAPVYVAPIFNKFQPLVGPLEERLRALASRYGVGNATIMRFDMSRQTKKANAYVAGLLGTHRIALADTLLEGFTNDEIEFVVAHELGHYLARDTWLGVGAGSLAMTFMIFAGNGLASRSGSPVTSIAGFARLGFFTQVLAALIGPLLAAGSRAIERRADRFALSATHRPDWGIAAFERLRERNMAEEEEPRWAELLIATHPSLRSRVASLRLAAAAQ